jgi:hypothetical protein
VGERESRGRVSRAKDQAAQTAVVTTWPDGSEGSLEFDGAEGVKADAYFRIGLRSQYWGNDFELTA